MHSITKNLIIWTEEVVYRTSSTGKLGIKNKVGEVGQFLQPLKWLVSLPDYHEERSEGKGGYW